MKIVSVIIPTCKRPTNLLRAIESVFQQSYKNLELIVVDDNGINTQFQEQTEQLIEPYKSYSNFKYLALTQNMGAAYARNKGVEMAMGSYVAFLDDDDAFLINKIKLQVDRLNSLGIDYGACYCRQQYLDNNNNFYPVNDEYTEGDLTKEILEMSNHLNTSSLLFRKECLIELNGFNTGLVRHEDWDLLLRFFMKYKIAIDLSGTPQLNRYIGSFSFAPIGKELILRQEIFIEQFMSYISCQIDVNLILKIQWAFVYKELFRQNHVFLGLKTAIKAHQYYPLNIKEWKWVVARFIKNLFKKYKQTL